MDTEAPPVVLALMMALELRFAELYMAASRSSESVDMKEFWARMSRQEESHAGYIDRIRKIYINAPEKFKIGSRFNPVILKSWLSEIGSAASKVKSGEIGPAELLSIASEYENTLMEKNYGEYLISDDAEYLALIGKITSDTAVHGKILRDKITETGSGA